MIEEYCKEHPAHCPQGDREHYIVDSVIHRGGKQLVAGKEALEIGKADKIHARRNVIVGEGCIKRKQQRPGSEHDKPHNPRENEHIALECFPLPELHALEEVHSHHPPLVGYEKWSGRLHSTLHTYPLVLGVADELLNITLSLIQGFLRRLHAEESCIQLRIDQVHIAS